MVYEVLYTICTNIYNIYKEHVNCDIDFEGQTFSYILDIQLHNLVRTLKSAVVINSEIYKSLVKNDIFPEDISSAAI